MKLKNVLIYSTVITCVCIVYVSLQVKVVVLSYGLRDKEKKLSQLIDANKVLVYNNTSLKAPQYLAGMLKQNEMELSLPDTSAVASVRVIHKDNLQLAKSAKVSREAGLADIFVPRAQAESSNRR